MSRLETFRRAIGLKPTFRRSGSAHFVNLAVGAVSQVVLQFIVEYMIDDYAIDSRCDEMLTQTSSILYIFSSRSRSLVWCRETIFLKSL